MKFYLHLGKVGVARMDPTYLRPAAQVCAFRNIIMRKIKKKLKSQILPTFQKSWCRTRPDIFAACGASMRLMKYHHAKNKKKVKISNWSQTQIATF